MKRREASIKRCRDQDRGSALPLDAPVRAGERVGAGVCPVLMAAKAKRRSSRTRKPPRAARSSAQLAEVFRAHGYEGTSLSLITEATGLGKGSLYNLFSARQEQMAEEVLVISTAGSIARWFAPLRDDPSGRGSRGCSMRSTVFQSGGRVCIVGIRAGCGRDHFGTAVRGYFKAWEDALALALRRQGFAARRQSSARRILCLHPGRPGAGPRQ